MDNASSNAATALPPFAERLKVIRNSENLGFTRANNRGVAEAKGEYLLFLNSDTRIGPDTLSRLVAFADAHPQAGAVGPLVLNGDGTFQLSFGRRFSLFSEFWQKAVAAPRAARTDPGKLKLREVGWVSGCCLLTRRDYFPAGKVFDEEIFLYFDDSELCARLEKMGKKMYLFPRDEHRPLRRRQRQLSARAHRRRIPPQPAAYLPQAPARLAVMVAGRLPQRQVPPAIAAWTRRKRKAGRRLHPGIVEKKNVASRCLDRSRMERRTANLFL